MDTVKLQLSKEYIPKGYKEKLGYIVEDFRPSTAKNKDVFYTGEYNNSKVYFNSYGITFDRFSMSNQYFGENITTTNAKQNKELIERVSYEFGLPLEKADVKRIDLPLTVATTFEPSTYYSSLGDCKGYSFKAPVINGIYYQQISNKSKVCIYDKVRHYKKEKRNIPQQYKDKNLFRLEFRATKQLTKTFNQSEIKVKQLGEPNFYNLVLDKTYSKYLDINKLNITTMLQPTPYVKNLNNQLNSIAVNMLGYNNVLSIIEVWKKQGLIDRKQYFDLKKNIRDKAKAKPLIHQKNELITELDQLMKEAYMGLKQ